MSFLAHAFIQPRKTKALVDAIKEKIVPKWKISIKRKPNEILWLHNFVFRQVINCVRVEWIEKMSFCPKLKRCAKRVNIGKTLSNFNFASVNSKRSLFLLVPKWLWRERKFVSVTFYECGARKFSHVRKTFFMA